MFEQVQLVEVAHEHIFGNVIADGFDNALVSGAGIRVALVSARA